MNTGRTRLLRLWISCLGVLRPDRRPRGDRRHRTLSMRRAISSHGIRPVDLSRELACAPFDATRTSSMAWDFAGMVRRSKADANRATADLCGARSAAHCPGQTALRSAIISVLICDNAVYALDSTTIDLCLAMFPWAHFRTSKAAVKMHTLLDLRGASRMYRIGKMHDGHALDLLPIAARRHLHHGSRLC